jgi:hypothetical protein
MDKQLSDGLSQLPQVVCNSDQLCQAISANAVCGKEGECQCKKGFAFDGKSSAVCVKLTKGWCQKKYADFIPMHKEILYRITEVFAILGQTVAHCS